VGDRPPAVLQRPPANLFEFFEQAAVRCPDRPAVRIGRGDSPWLSYSYRDLLAAAARLDADLLRSSLEAGDRVALYAESSPEWAVAYVALQRAGLVAVPLDPQLSASQVAEAVGFTGTRLALIGRVTRATSEELRGALPGVPCLPLLPPLVPPPGTGPGSGAVPARPRTGDRTASLLFTSGTLKCPRAVALTHCNFLANVEGLLACARLGDGEQFLSVLPLYHSFEFTVGFLMALGAGACVTYADEIKGPRITELMRRTGTTRMVCVPRLLQLFAGAIRQKVRERGPAARAAFSLCRMLSRASRATLARLLFAPVHRQFGGRLQSFCSGGSALDPDVARLFFDLGLPVYEGYGLTETAPVLTTNHPGAWRIGSVGWPLPGVEVRVQDPGPGGIGEVWARGPNVFAGYHRDPEATEAAFAGGWFRTGDLGRLDPDGCLHLTGRLKDVIIPSAGKNVHPDEVERNFAELPHVRELCVLGVPGADRGEEVHLVLVPEEVPGRSRADVESAVCAAAGRVAATLPSHQRPHRLHLRREALPRTSTLKVRRPALRELLAQAPGGQPRSRGEREPLETTRTLAAVRSALGAALSDSERAAAARPGDHLQLDLGLDSIGLHQLLCDLEARYRLPVPPREVAGLCRVEDLVRLLEASQPAVAAGTGDVAPARARPGTRASYFLLTPARWGARAVLGLLGKCCLSVEVAGLDRLPCSGPFLIAANHCSHLDTLVVRRALRGVCPVRVAGATDYFCRGFFSRMVSENLLDIIPVERDGRTLNGLERCLGQLRRAGGRREALLVFPEGTRSPDGTLQPFKNGLGLLMSESGVPVVPAHIEGTYALMPRGSRWPRPGRARIVLGEPLHAADVPFEGRPGTQAHCRAVTEHIRERVRALSC
jgi:long-chain acyl-CoA synthetase